MPAFSFEKITGFPNSSDLSPSASRAEFVSRILISRFFRASFFSNDHSPKHICVCAYSISNNRKSRRQLYMVLPVSFRQLLLVVLPLHKLFLLNTMQLSEIRITAANLIF